MCCKYGGINSCAAFPIAVNSELEVCLDTTWSPNPAAPQMSRWPTRGPCSSPRVAQTTQRPHPPLLSQPLPNSSQWLRQGPTPTTTLLAEGEWWNIAIQCYTLLNHNWKLCIDNSVASLKLPIVLMTININLIYQTSVWEWITIWWGEERWYTR